MNTTIARLFVIGGLLAAATLYANPIYMKYDGIDGSVSAQAEVLNGKATLKKLKPGTYRVSLIFTGRDAKTPDGKPRTMAHVKIFDGRTGYASGVRVAVGDVNGDGKETQKGLGIATKNTSEVTMAEYGLVLGAVGGQTSRGMGTGKVSVKDFSMTLMPNGNDVVGQLGTIEITPGSHANAFFDVFTELSLD